MTLERKQHRLVYVRRVDNSRQHPAEPLHLMPFDPDRHVILPPTPPEECGGHERHIHHVNITIRMEDAQPMLATPGLGLLTLIRKTVFTLILIAALAYLNRLYAHAQTPDSFRLDFHAFDGGASISGTTPDGRLFSGSITAHPFDGGWSANLRYDADGKQRECNATVAPFNGQARVDCR